MKVKLIEVKPIGENKFEVTTSVDGAVRKDVIFRKTDVPVESMGESLTYFTAENQDFYEIWGSSFEFRKEVSRQVGEIVKETELQPV